MNAPQRDRSTGGEDPLSRKTRNRVAFCLLAGASFVLSAWALLSPTLRGEQTLQLLRWAMLFLPWLLIGEAIRRCGKAEIKGVPSAPGEAPSRRFPIKTIVGVALAIPFAYLALVVVFLFAWGMSDFDDDEPYVTHGPYFGLEAPVPRRAPSQTLTLPNGIVLESYDPESYEAESQETESQETGAATALPIVLARDPNGTTRWCIRVEADAPRKVTRVRFLAHFGQFLVTSTGATKSTDYSVEWSLNPNGDLRHYFYYDG